MSILPFTPRPRPESGRFRSGTRLFCFPYAGGSATTIYRTWPESLPRNIEVCPIQLPGRGPRFAEQPLTQMDDLVTLLVKELQPFMNVPFAFFGHSMGALISFELARRLEEETGSGPLQLFVSSFAAPSLPRAQTSVRNLEDERLLERLQKLQGTPTEIMAQPEIIQHALQVFRADVALCETYEFTPGTLLSCPISVFGGRQDPIVSPETLKQWQPLTRESCSVNLFAGNHFFLHQAQSDLTEIIASRLFSQEKNLATGF